MLNAGQKYCRMRGAFSNFSTCNKLPSVFKTFVLSLVEWPLKTGSYTTLMCVQKTYTEHVYLVELRLYSYDAAINPPTQLCFVEHFASFFFFYTSLKLTGFYL